MGTKPVSQTNGGGADGMSLRDLILTMKGGRTYAGLEIDSGDVVKAQRWNQLANGIRIAEFPEPRTLTAMAHALNVDVEIVLLAFARTLGLPVRRRRSVFADLLPPMADKLTDKQQDAVLAVIRAMADRGAEVVQDPEGDLIAGSKTKPEQPQDNSGI